MADEPTADIIKREIAEAARILREDGYAATQREIKAKLDKHFPDEPPPDPKDDPNAPPTPPDKKEPPNDPDGKKKSSIWWGDVSDE